MLRNVNHSDIFPLISTLRKHTDVFLSGQDIVPWDLQAVKYDTKFDAIYLGEVVRDDNVCRDEGSA